MRVHELRELQLDFIKDIDSLKGEYDVINSKRLKFVSNYPTGKIELLSLDEYVVGKRDKNSFCYRIETELTNWGDIHGSPAKKFGLYYGTFGQDKVRKYRIGKKLFGKTPSAALGNVLNAIVELIEYKNDLESLILNPISPMYKGKILSIYFPEEFLNIYSAKHLNYFINALGLVNTSKQELDKQQVLLNFKNNDYVMIDWTIYQFSKFLYTSFGKPNDEINEERLTGDLKKSQLKDFPPIESIKVEFIELATKEFSKTPKITSTKKKKKVDYVAQTKNQKRIGDRGEQVVLLAEQHYLIINGRPDLAEKVIHVSVKDDGAGYDILSYDLEGNTKYLEVKSTTRKIGFSNLFISANEMGVANELGEYYFYIVFEVDTKNPKIWRIKGSKFLNDKKIKLSPVLYKIDFNTKLQ